MLLSSTYYSKQSYVSFLLTFYQIYQAFSSTFSPVVLQSKLAPARSLGYNDQGEVPRNVPRPLRPKSLHRPSPSGRPPTSAGAGATAGGDGCSYGTNTATGRRGFSNSRVRNHVDFKKVFFWWFFWNDKKGERTKKFLFLKISSSCE